MISKDKDRRVSLKSTESNGNAALEALVLKKGKRNVSEFKKLFGIDPDFPSVEEMRKAAWR